MTFDQYCALEYLYFKSVYPKGHLITEVMMNRKTADLIKVDYARTKHANDVDLAWQFVALDWNEIGFRSSRLITDDTLNDDEVRFIRSPGFEEKYFNKEVKPSLIFTPEMLNASNT